MGTMGGLHPRGSSSSSSSLPSSPSPSPSSSSPSPSSSSSPSPYLPPSRPEHVSSPTSTTCPNESLNPPTLPDVLSENDLCYAHSTGDTCPLTHFSRSSLKSDFRVWEYPELLTPEECAALIRAGDGKWERSRVQVGNTTAISQFRSSSTAWVSPSEKTKAELAALRIRQHASKLSGVQNFNRRATEKVQIVKYEEGQEYKLHTDSLKSPDGSLKGRGTLLVYLNDNFEGGQTVFPFSPKTVIPKAGKAVFWYTLIGPEGLEDHRSKHAGLPVSRGVKYLATQWFLYPEKS